MKKTILFLFITVSLSSFAQCTFNWGTVSYPLGKGLKKDFQNNIITLESTGGGPGYPNYIYIKKRNYQGSLLFSKTVSCNDLLRPGDIAIDINNNIYVTGSYYGQLCEGGTCVSGSVDASQAFVLKLTSAGTLVWLKSSGGNITGSSADGDDEGLSVSADSSGNCYLQGGIRVPFTFDSYVAPNAVDKLFLAKLDGATGNLTWIKSFVDWYNTGNYSSIQTTKNSETYFLFDYNMYTIYVDSLNTLSYSPPNFNLAVVRYDANGNLKGFTTSSGNVHTQSCTLDKNEVLYVSGTFADSLKIPGLPAIQSSSPEALFITKIDTTGTATAIENLANASAANDLSIAPYGLVVDSSCSIYYGGTILSTTDFNGIIADVSLTHHQRFVTKLSNTFISIWNNTFHSSPSTFGFDIGLVKLEGKNVYAQSAYYDTVTVGTCNFYASIFGYYFTELCDSDGSISGPASIDEHGLNNLIIISPNPAKNELRITNEELKIQAIHIYNVLGETVESSVIGGSTSPATGITMDVSALQNGIYFVEVISTGSTTNLVRKKFIKQ